MEKDTSRNDESQDWNNSSDGFCSSCYCCTAERSEVNLALRQSLLNRCLSWWVADLLGQERGDTTRRLECMKG